ncbi:MAG: flagellar basal body P-ring formation chaperone FlgA [Desulfobacterium sp.]|nr:flagellar basal body P-ring formation chaperone FlgA [Desulfobacterium sp.]
MEQPIRFLGFLLFFLFFSAASGGTPAYGNEPDSVLIEINSDARVNAREYLLKDIASVKGPGMIRQALEDYTMGFSPAIGKVKHESGQRLASKLESISWLPPTARISFPDSVFIKRVGQELPQEMLAGLFHDYVRERVGVESFEIREFKTRGVDLYPLGKLDLSVRSRNNRDVKGRVSLHADVLVDDVSQGRISISGYVDVYDKVVCATRSLSRGMILEPKDLSLRRINVSKIPDTYLTMTDMAVGMRLRQNVGANYFFRTGMLEKPPLVSRGDNVVLVAKKGNMRILATGVADQEGGLGDQIQVNNPTTNRTVLGRISGSKTVDVFF